MTEAPSHSKNCVVNPLKASPALGGAMAFFGIDGCLPMLHGSQGCTAFALVLMVRHFREAIPLQTTAMSEINTILGGTDNVEQAIGNVFERAKPKVIGICSTALTETRGEDIVADLRAMRERHPEWSDLAVVYATTPDYGGSIEEGWSNAVCAIIDELVPQTSDTRTLRQVNLLPGSHLTPADVESLVELIEGFGLTAIVVPDLSSSLDGHVPDVHVPTSLGGTTREAMAEVGHSVLTLAIGEHMRAPAAAIEARAGVPFKLFNSVTGLAAVDAFVEALLEAGGIAPERVRRERSRLVDAMLDAHFFIDRRRVAVAGEADHVLALTQFLASMGAETVVAVAPVATAATGRIQAGTVLIGDLDDLEQAAAGCDLMLANSHAREGAARIGVPLYRIGFPVFDRLGGPQRSTVGYRGTSQFLFDLANTFMDHGAAHEAHDAPAHETGRTEHAQAQAG